jgi:membrane-bound metal-dependent hydrolase YbcI (DUF457 family)
VVRKSCKSVSLEHYILKEDFIRRQYNPVKMYLLGHFAIGFLAGRAVSRFTNYKVNVPLVLIVSILPDIDLLIPSLPHRGPTHSIILITIIYIPFFILNKRSLVYFASLASHPLIGDYLTSYGCKILWPISNHYFKAPAYIHIPYSMDLTIEFILFIVAAMIMFYDHSRIHVEKAKKSRIIEV